MPKSVFEVERSPIGLFIFCAIVICSFGISLTLPLSGLIKAIMLIAIFTYAGMIAYQDVVLWGRQSIIKLEWKENNQLWICTPVSRQEVELMGDSTVTPWVSILRFKAQGLWQPRSCLIFCDSLPIGDYRRLMVRLRMC